MDSCHTLTSLSANCDATKKVGGVTERIWIGSKRRFLDANITPQLLFEYTPQQWTINIDNYDLIVGNELASFDGIRLKNTGGFEVTGGENVNAFTHNITAVLFHKSQAELSKIETLLLDGDLIVFIRTEADQIKVYGIDKDATDNVLTWDGLKPISGTGADIVELQGDVGVTIQLQGTYLGMPIIISHIYDMTNNLDYYDTTDLVNVLNFLSANNA